MGEQISEKAGVLNIGIEGMMLAGAYGGFVAAYYSESFGSAFSPRRAGHGGRGADGFALRPPRSKPDVHWHCVDDRTEGMTALLHYFQFSRTYPRLPKAPVLEVQG